MYNITQSLHQFYLLVRLEGDLSLGAHTGAQFRHRTETFRQSFLCPNFLPLEEKLENFVTSTESMLQQK